MGESFVEHVLDGPGEGGGFGVGGVLESPAEVVGESEEELRGHTFVIYDSVCFGLFDAVWCCLMPFGVV